MNILLHVFMCCLYFYTPDSRSSVFHHKIIHVFIILWKSVNLSMSGLFEASGSAACLVTVMSTATYCLQLHPEMRPETQGGNNISGFCRNTQVRWEELQLVGHKIKSCYQEGCSLNTLDFLTGCQHQSHHKCQINRVERINKSPKIRY